MAASSRFANRGGIGGGIAKISNRAWRVALRWLAGHHRGGSKMAAALAAACGVACAAGEHGVAIVMRKRGGNRRYQRGGRNGGMPKAGQLSSA